MFRVRGEVTIYLTVKSLNNNLVLAVNEYQEELVLFGKGIGFKKKKGDEIDSELITKIFQSKAFPQDISAIMENISPEILAVAEKMMQLGEEGLAKKLNSSMFIALADHLQAAVNRQNEGISLTENTLQWEIPFLYYKEYEVGKRALELVKDELGVQLPILEAAFIALHFVNAQDDSSSMNETLLITEITKSIVKTIQSLFGISLPKDSINYSRFVTHIRYFMNRHLHNQVEQEARNQNLYKILQEQYPQSYACGLMIRELLKNNYQITVNDDEMVYLILHIERIVSETKTE